MDRYEDVIPNFDEFLDVLEQPQPNDVRVNTLKSSVEKVKQLLEEEGIDYARRDEHKQFFSLDSAPGKSYPHWRGDYYVQEFSSAIPPMVLDPQPGERVLDMCAAPGSKTTQMAAMMNNNGVIQANDVRMQRTRSLLANIYRTGAVNVEVTECDGRQLPEDETFDKVLVDVPCSGEGNAREKPELREGADPERINSLATLQKQLLEKAFRLCREGGTVVYSTCTFAPEENELVVREFLDEAELVKPELGVEHSRGVTRWKGEELDDRLANCVRIYPHQLDSGGMFVATFEG